MRKLRAMEKRISRRGLAEIVGISRQTVIAIPVSGN